MISQDLDENAGKMQTAVTTVAMDRENFPKELRGNAL